MRDAKGRFLPGPDPDRHILTRAERQKGYFYAMTGKMASRVRAWLRKKIRRHYQDKAEARRQRAAG
jgi:hypothetical protein